MKQCNQCKQLKDESEFYKDRTKKDSYATICILCKKKNAKPYIPKPFISVGEIRSKRDEYGRKYCEKCKQWKYESDFYKDIKQKDGLCYVCKQCSYTPKIYQSPLLIRDKQGRKQCTKCKQWLKIEYFGLNKTNADGLSGVCKLCINKYRREKQIKPKYNLNKETREGQKQCSSCKQWKNLDDFGLNRCTKDGHNCRCKQCITKWYAENKEQVTEYRKEYRAKNKDKLIKYAKNYYQNNKKYLNEYSKEYRKDNIEYLKEYDRRRNEENKLSRCMSRGIWHSIKHNKAGQHWEDLVPYTLQELKEHLESQFDENMSWDNYGSYWEIDHIKPQNTFNITSPDDPDFQICWSLANLRPLEKSLNRQRPKDGSDIKRNINDY